MKKKFFLLLLPAVLFCSPKVEATPENNPPICSHDWVETGSSDKPYWDSARITVSRDMASSVLITPAYTTYTCSLCGASYTNYPEPSIICKDWDGNDVTVCTIQLQPPSKLLIMCILTFDTGGVFYLTLDNNPDPNGTLEVRVNGDDDGDGLNSPDEVLIFGTDPYDPDEDNDGWIDGYEIYYFGNLNSTPIADDDSDGVSNYLESVLELDNSKTPVTPSSLNLIIY